VTDQSETLYGFLLSYVISLEFFVSSHDHLLLIAEWIERLAGCSPLLSSFCLEAQVVGSFVWSVGRSFQVHVALVSLADLDKRHGRVFAVCPPCRSPLVLIHSLILLPPQSADVHFWVLRTGNEMSLLPEKSDFTSMQACYNKYKQEDDKFHQYLKFIR